MRDAGVELIEHVGRLAVMGFVEVIGTLGKHWRLFREIRRRLRSGSVAAGGARGLPGLQHARGLGGDESRRTGVVLHHAASLGVARGSAEKTGAYRDAAPPSSFRSKSRCCARTECRVSFVGHPLLDRAGSMPARAAARATLGLAVDARVLALFPGSRRQEIEHNLDAFVATARELQRRDPQLTVVVAAAPHVTLDAARCPFPLVRSASFTVLRAADAALCKSGTTTLEAAVAGCPFVVAYRLNQLNYAIGKRLVKIPNIGLVNIVAGYRARSGIRPGRARAERGRRRTRAAARPRERRTRRDDRRARTRSRITWRAWCRGARRRYRDRARRRWSRRACRLTQPRRRRVVWLARAGEWLVRALGCDLALSRDARRRGPSRTRGGAGDRVHALAWATPAAAVPSPARGRRRADQRARRRRDHRADRDRHGIQDRARVDVARRVARAAGYRRASSVMDTIWRSRPTGRAGREVVRAGSDHRRAANRRAVIAAAVTVSTARGGSRAGTASSIPTPFARVHDRVQRCRVTSTALDARHAADDVDRMRALMASARAAGRWLSAALSKNSGTAIGAWRARRRALLTPAARLFGAVVGARDVMYDAGWLRVARVADSGDEYRQSHGRRHGEDAGRRVAGARIRSARARGPPSCCAATAATSRSFISSLNPRRSPSSPAPIASRALSKRPRLGADVARARRRVSAPSCTARCRLVLVSADRWTADVRLLPAGPWREPLRAVRRATLVIVTRKAASESMVDAVNEAVAAVAPSLPRVSVRLEPDLLVRATGAASATGARSVGDAAHDPDATRPINTIRGESIHAVLSIADPRSFIRQLEAHGARVRASVFRDHHAFTDADIARVAGSLGDAEWVVCTLKDAVKLGAAVASPCAAVVVCFSAGDGGARRWGARAILDASGPRCAPKPPNTPAPPADAGPFHSHGHRPPTSH